MHLLRLGLIAAAVVAVAVLLGLPGCQKVDLYAPPTSTILLSANPTVVPENGGVSTLRATVRLANGELVPDGVIVNFFTTLGRIDSQAKTVSGVATATLTATGATGVARVTAVSGGAESAAVDVTFGSVIDTVAVSFSPGVLPSGGGSATVTVRVLGSTGVPAPGRGVTLAASSPGTLASGGATLITDASGIVSDRLTTTATSTVTATVTGLGLTGNATLIVGGSEATSLVATANPPSLPTGGGSVEIRAFVTGSGSGPVVGQTVKFSANQGSLSVAEDVTDSQGLARSVLTSNARTTVTVEAGTLRQLLVVEIGAPSASPYTITLSASRTALTSTQTSGTSACDPAAGSAQQPVEVVALVADGAARPVANVSVTLEIDDDPADAWDGFGGFCPGAATATAECCPGQTVCLPPAPTPTPSPTPAATPTPSPTPTPVCCNVSTLPKLVTLRTGSDGQARYSFAFEDSDLCTCVFANKSCTARILASAPNAAAANELVISLNR